MECHDSDIGKSRFREDLLRVRISSLSHGVASQVVLTGLFPDRLGPQVPQNPFASKAMSGLRRDARAFLRSASPALSAGLPRTRPIAGHTLPGYPRFPKVAREPNTP